MIGDCHFGMLNLLPIISNLAVRIGQTVTRTIAYCRRTKVLKPSSHYMYRPLVTICTAQWSLYVPHSGHYMYRTVVTIYTA